MRARTVYESLSFRKGMDPKKAMGIGINPKDEKTFSDYLASELPHILGTETIPEDIIKSSSHYINNKYNEKINKYLADLLPQYGINPFPKGGEDIVNTEPTIEYNIWDSLNLALRRLGYRRS